ncbi:MAG: hypothetical protein ACXVFN_14265 [Solirubrobacteraceae bacterium]
MSDAPLMLGPIYGLRSWGVVGAPGHERLVGPHRGTPWPSGGTLLEAECSAMPPHTPPGKGCWCGVHAWHPSRRAARRACSFRREVAGILEAWGAVEVHADGFRAERGRPHALVLLPRGNARRLERLAAVYDADLLRLDGPGALLAHCRERGLGLGEDVVAEFLGPEVVAGGRRERRRRGALTAVAAAAVLALGGVDVIAGPGTQQGKVPHGRSGDVRTP